MTVNKDQKYLLEQAAGLSGLNLDNYLLVKLLEIAKEELALQDKLILSQRDWDLLISTLEDPPAPNAKLKSAFTRFRSKYGQSTS
ncbi:MAG: DUF1778 domain-containing protein [Symploca sp. SIO1B1]|nr:DUF1778 domain-containing protein [Symploca sp. SIO1C2]NES00374.1 DUF1778 domain-containing protein [Symploca sp. SIO1B1]